MKKNGKMVAYPRSKSAAESGVFRRGFTQHPFCTKYKKGAGFTIIELLVVIAIIGILLAIGIPMLNESREKARDSKRISDLKQLEFALEVYYEANGHYPDEKLNGPIGEDNNLNADEPNSLDDLLFDFMKSVPSDPTGDSAHQYIYTADASCGSVIYAKTMEKPELNANTEDVCSELGSDGYAIVLSSSNF